MQSASCHLMTSPPMVVPDQNPQNSSWIFFRLLTSITSLANPSNASLKIYPKASRFSLSLLLPACVLPGLLQQPLTGLPPSNFSSLYTFLKRKARVIVLDLKTVSSKPGNGSSFLSGQKLKTYDSTTFQKLSSSHPLFFLMLTLLPPQLPALGTLPVSAFAVTFAWSPSSGVISLLPLKTWLKYYLFSEAHVSHSL